MQKQTIIKCSYKEIDKLAQKHFPIYEFTAVEEACNGDSRNFNVDGKLDEWEMRTIQRWEDGEFLHYSSSTVLNWLAKNEEIELGEYLVEVYW